MEYALCFDLVFLRHEQIFLVCDDGITKVIVNTSNVFLATGRGLSQVKVLTYLCAVRETGAKP